MNKYSDKSDFEINKAVAEVLIQSGFIIGIKYHDKHILVTDKYANNYPFDPCNNPADAMPIVFENGISIIFDTGCKAWVAGIAYWVDGCEWQVSYEVERMNQYRAAMEVFLMMKDAENEK
ncbi:phage protein NinX family protein [Morganella morganii]|uniref:phage protein NinX family protein n=1 Tax=Morganella morganii TaxID=582 RepID=UPI001891BA6F|nr:phage protein NinX family protein [Morganella morganii]